MDLKSIDFFANLDEKNIKKMEKISTFLKMNSGEILFYEGDEPKYLHILLNGVIKLYKTDLKGHQVFMHHFTPVSLVGELANFENMPYPATAEAVVNSEILRINFSELSEDFFKNPDVSMQIIKSLSQKAKILTNVIHKEMILSTEAKIAKLIVENGEIFKEFKNTQIANILNITPETLSRTLTRFKKMGYIEIDKKHSVKLLNKKALEILYKGCL